MRNPAVFFSSTFYAMSLTIIGLTTAKLWVFLGLETVATAKLYFLAVHHVFMQYNGPSSEKMKLCDAMHFGTINTTMYRKVRKRTPCGRTEGGRTVFLHASRFPLILIEGLIVSRIRETINCFAVRTVISRFQQLFRGIPRNNSMPWSCFAVSPRNNS